MSHIEAQIDFVHHTRICSLVTSRSAERVTDTSDIAPRSRMSVLCTWAMTRPFCRAGEFGSAAIAVRNILRREGVRGLFAGYGSFLLRDLPFDAIEFVAYEQLKSMYKVRQSYITRLRLHKPVVRCQAKDLNILTSARSSLARFLKITHHTDTV